VSVHHPYDDTLARYAAGRLGAGPALVVATHFAGCPECRARVGLFEAVGGALLEEGPPATVRADLFAATLRGIENAGDTKPAHFARTSPLDRMAMPPWRSAGLGFQWRRLVLPDDPRANVIMLKVAPGRKMPHHTHRGTEYTQVLQGAFHDDYGRYVAGDCIEADDDVSHQPVVDSDVDCVCVAAVAGRLRLTGWIGRLVQPLFGL